jgi:hypothetical protein
MLTATRKLTLNNVEKGWQIVDQGIDVLGFDGGNRTTAWATKAGRALASGVIPSFIGTGNAAKLARDRLG